MRPRAWPGALLSGASLAAACLVVGDHVAATRQGCPDSAGWFSATPVVLPSDPTRSGAEGKPAPDKTGSGQSTSIDEVGQNRDDTPSGEQISGCLDIDRIVVPPPAPVPDGRA